MNERLRLPVAFLLSLLIHFALLTGILQQVKVRAPIGQGMMQVFLQNNTVASIQPLLLPVGTSIPGIKNPQSKPTLKPASIPALPNGVADGQRTSGHFHWQPPPANQQDELMNSMHLAQLAQQRESRVATVLSDMSNLAAQLRPLTNTRIVCAQQEDNEIDCSPEPEENIRPLLEHFFSLSMEARRLGVARNPVRMDFGPELGVSVTLRP